jgi:hypothetical protein
MSNEPSFENFDATIRHLGEAFHRWVRSEMAGKPWSRGTLEVRYASDGSYWHDKMRVEVPGQEVVSLGTTPEIGQTLADLNDLRRIFGWYSLRLDVGNDGKATTNYDYDPKSSEDPSFFAD